MNKHLQKILLLSIAAFFYTTSLWARDALLLELQDVVDYFAGPKFWVFMLISIFVEAIFFTKFIKGVVPTRAFLMSLVGNTISFLARAFVIPLVLMGIAYGLGINIPYPENVKVIVILACIGSLLLELGALRIIFKYTIRQLFIPVLVGNATTYILTFMYLKYQ